MLIKIGLGVYLREVVSWGFVVVFISENNEVWKVMYLDLTFLKRGF